MVIKQFNTNRPNEFDASRTQVNINIAPATRTTADGIQDGFEYTTVVFENCFAYTDEALIELAKKQVALEYLASTDFKMTVDYYATLTAEEQKEITAKRAEARAFLKANGL